MSTWVGSAGEAGVRAQAEGGVAVVVRWRSGARRSAGNGWTRPEVAQGVLAALGWWETSVDDGVAAAFVGMLGRSGKAAGMLLGSKMRV